MMLKLGVGSFNGFFSRILSFQVLITMAMPFNIDNSSDSRSDSCVWEFSPTICGEDSFGSQDSDTGNAPPLVQTNLPCLLSNSLIVLLLSLISKSLNPVRSSAPVPVY
ncbi:uncharacterized protein Z520_02781 [Fonsecaea multimorphosa CBS 102226]|uniref:Uncharacterized protein n=1 Tax=Fonsecaea multimorphosa CBS 102226 TaxID=1442371 RepID=A0A0D2KWM8_9EURO|nr:uncharacterized protein Z520_02781 [Fonsecaea multimorphosa CBS 102226]KIY01229.1 hypothetical protein Z520_02781 [Fonsecaea multimorphosa CBS 102226]